MKVFKIIMLLILIGIITAVGAVFYAFFVEPHKVTTENVSISDTEIKKDLTIAVFADTHFTFDTYTMEDFNKAVAAIKATDPDIIVFLGDLYDNYDKYHDNESQVISALSSLHASIGKYAVFGNHDYGGGAENHYASIMNRGGFRVLKNSSVSLSSYNVNLVGIDDCLIGYGQPSVANNSPASAYNIVICHEPDVIDKLSSSPVDLMISGHTHGGQAELPFYENKFLPSLGKEYVSGKYSIDNSAQTTLYVNRGLGTTHMEVRFMSVPEVTCIRLSK
jgi:predicted MPP superfamily phosphohydrolase